MHALSGAGNQQRKAESQRTAVIEEIVRGSFSLGDRGVTMRVLRLSGQFLALVEKVEQAFANSRNGELR